MLEPLINVEKREKLEEGLRDSIAASSKEVDTFDKTSERYLRVRKKTQEQTKNPERIFKFTVAKLLREEPYIKEVIQQVLNLPAIGDQIRSELSAENLELFLKNLGPKKKDGSKNQTEKQRVAESATVYRPLIAAIMRVPGAKELFLKAIGWRDEQRSNELKTYIRKENKEGRIPFANIVIIGGGSQANVIATDLQRLVGNDISVVIIDGGNGRGSIDGALRMNSAARKATDDDNPLPGFGGDINPVSEGAMVGVADLTSDFYASGIDKGNETQINGVFSAALKILNEYVDLKDVTFDAEGMTINFGVKENSQKIKSELMIVAGGLGNPNEYPFDPTDDEIDEKTEEIFDRERAKGENSRILTYRERLQEGLDPENFAPNRKYVNAVIGIAGGNDTAFVLVEGFVGKNEGTQQTLDAKQYGDPKKIVLTTSYKTRADLIKPGIAKRPRYNTLCDVFPKEEGDDSKIVDPVDGRLIGLVDPPAGKDVLVGLYQLSDGTRITKELDFLFLATGQDRTERANFIEEQVGGFSISRNELLNPDEFQKIKDKIKNEGPECLIGAQVVFVADTDIDEITKVTKSSTGNYSLEITTFNPFDDNQGEKSVFSLEGYIDFLRDRAENGSFEEIYFDATNPFVPELFLEEIIDEETGEIVAKRIKGTNILLAGVYANIRLTDEEKKKAEKAFKVENALQVVALWRTIRKSMIFTRQYLARRLFKRGKSDLKLNNEAYELPVTNKNNFVQQFTQTLSPEITAYKGELGLNPEEAFRLRFAGLLHDIKWPEVSNGGDYGSFSLFVTRIRDGDLAENSVGDFEKATINDEGLDELRCNIAPDEDLLSIDSIIRSRVLADEIIQKYLALLTNRKNSVAVDITIVKGEKGVDLRNLDLRVVPEKPSKRKVLKKVKQDFQTSGKMELPAINEESTVEKPKEPKQVVAELGKTYKIEDDIFSITNGSNDSGETYALPESYRLVRALFNKVDFVKKVSGWKIINKNNSLLSVAEAANKEIFLNNEDGTVINDVCVINIAADLYVQCRIDDENDIEITFLDKNPLEKTQENQNKESNIERIRQLEVGSTYDINDNEFVITNQINPNSNTEQLFLNAVETDSPIVFSFSVNDGNWTFRNDSRLAFVFFNPYNQLEIKTSDIQDISEDGVIEINEKLFLYFSVDEDNKISVKVFDSNPFDPPEPEDDSEGYNDMKDIEIELGETYNIAGNSFSISTKDNNNIFSAERFVLPAELETVRFPVFIDTVSQKQKWKIGNANVGIYDIQNNGKIERIESAKFRDLEDNDVLKIAENYYVRFNIDANNKMSVTFYSEDSTKKIEEDSEQIPEENNDFYNRSYEFKGDAELNPTFGFADYADNSGVNLPSTLRKELGDTNITFTRFGANELRIQLKAGSDTKIISQLVRGQKQESDLRVANDYAITVNSRFRNLIKLTDTTSLLITYNQVKDTYSYKFIKEPYENLKDRDFIALSNGAEEKNPVTTETEEETFPEFELNKKLIFKKTFVLGKITNDDSKPLLKVPEKYKNVPLFRFARLIGSNDWFSVNYTPGNSAIKLSNEKMEIDLGDDLLAKVEIVNDDLQLEFVEKVTEEEKMFFGTTRTFDSSFVIGREISSQSLRYDIPVKLSGFLSNDDELLVRKITLTNSTYWIVETENNSFKCLLISGDIGFTDQISIFEGRPTQIQISESLTLQFSITDTGKIAVKPFNGPLNPAYFS